MHAKDTTTKPGRNRTEGDSGGARRAAVIQRVVERLHAKPLKNKPGEYEAKCPHHDDTDPSLWLKDGDRGVIAHCRVGCTFKEIVAASGIPAKQWFYGDKATAIKGNGHLVAAYPYRGDGQIEKRRHEPKDFRWFRNGKPGLGGLKPNDLLFHEELLKPDDARVVYLTEGEKAALALDARELLAVAGAGGEGWRPTPRVIELFRGRHVRLWPDNDEAGRRWRGNMVAALAPVVADLDVVVVPDVAAKADAADFHGTDAEIEQHVYNPEILAVADAHEQAHDMVGFTQVARVTEDLAGLSPLAWACYAALFLDKGFGIARCVQLSPAALGARITGRPVLHRQIRNYSVALAALERNGIIVRDDVWIYLRRVGRFQPIKGKQVPAALKFLQRAPAKIADAMLADEPAVRAARPSA